MEHKETHTSQEIKVIEEYNDSVDDNVEEFIQNVIKDEGAKKFVRITNVTEVAADRIRKLTGYDLQGYEVVLDKNAVNHIIKRHGENGVHDKSMADMADIARMGYVLTNFDEIDYDGRTTTGYVDAEGKPSPMVIYSKRIDGKYYIVKATGSSKQKRSYVVSAYIVNA